MKKKAFIGILVMVLAAVASYILYYKFRAAVIGFGITAVVFPVAFQMIKPSVAWLSIGLAIVADLLICWPEFSYYESRGLFIVAVLVQAVIMAMIILVFKLVSDRRKKDPVRLSPKMDRG